MAEGAQPKIRMSFSPKRRQLLFGGIFLLFSLLCLLVWWLALLSEASLLARIASTGQGRLELYSSSLKETLNRYRPLPYLLARDSRIVDLLHGKLQAIRVNPHLEDFGKSADGLIFILNQQGTTVATSNWRTQQSLMGVNFSFRPYFLDAKNGNPGGYYAVGIKTGQPGFFLSRPILDTGRFLGAVVVKIDLERLQQSWRESHETVIVSDVHGVLFLSSRPEWRYHCLRDLPKATIDDLHRSQYPGKPLTPLQMGRNVAEAGNILELDHNRFLEQSNQLLQYGWRIHYLSDLRPALLGFRLTLAMGAILVAGLFLTLLYLRERRQKKISRDQAREAEAIRALNERLRQEIEEHRETEAALRHTQRELIQAGKLAALGRMSAGITHELNQPVTAIRTFLASCRILLERNKLSQVEENLDQISQLTDRMATITSQLKIFARKEAVPRENLDLRDILLQVLLFCRPQLEEAGIQLLTEIPDPGKAMVRGNRLQLEQVIQNLLKNGMDACEQSSAPQIQISLTPKQNNILLTVHDNGSGFDDESIESLFEPFYTTKEVGKGLGLGLAICYGIVQEMDGNLSAHNHPEGGGVMTISLPTTVLQTE